MPESCPQGVVDLWEACIGRDPNERPSAMEVQECLQSLLPVTQRGALPALLPFQPIPVDSFVMQVIAHLDFCAQKFT